MDLLRKIYQPLQRLEFPLTVGGWLLLAGLMLYATRARSSPRRSWNVRMIQSHSGPSPQFMSEQYAHTLIAIQKEFTPAPSQIETISFCAVSQKRGASHPQHRFANTYR